MSQCKNRGKFNGKKGRPSAQDYKDLEEAGKKYQQMPFPTFDELMALRTMEIEDVKNDEIADLKDIEFSESMDDAEWMRSLIEQAHNPFYLKIQGTVTRVFH